MNCLMIITGSDKKQSKVILTTAQAFQIANLIREYTEVLQAAVEETLKEGGHVIQPLNSHAQQMAPKGGQDVRKTAAGTRPQSMLLRNSSTAATLVAPQPS